jgi:hypothetical protein
MDNLVYEESINTEIDQSEFISKKWIYVNDNNSQNYTSQVVIDTTPLANSGGYVNWQEAFIIMPLVVQLESANATINVGTSPRLDKTWAFKSGFMNMIHSMTIEYNNSNVVQQTPLINVYKNFEILTSYSKDDIKNHSDTTAFYPDTARTWGINDNASANVYSGCTGPAVLFNNCVSAGYSTASNTGGATGIAPTVFDYLNQNDFINQGALSRTYLTSNGSTGQSLSQQALLSTDILRQQYINTRVVNDSATTKCVWEIYAKIYLKDLSDLFKKTPLLKGSTLRLYINTNQCKISYNLVDGYVDASSVSVSVNGGSTNPLMITNLMGPVCKALGSTGTRACSLSVSIVQNNYDTFGASNFKTSLTACRLYAPVYKFTAIAEQKYLSLTPTKTIEYNDVFQYQFSDVQRDFNILVSNGIPNIQSVLVVPTIQASTSDIQAVPYNTLLSPFTSAPSTPDPLPLTNFNVLVSGVNLFLDDEQYDFQQFLEELMSSNQLNGNLTTGLTSGQISERDFNWLYRYYYGNCKRVLPAEEGVSRSIQVRGKVNTANADLKSRLLVFVQFKRKITLDILTGARIE